MCGIIGCFSAHGFNPDKLAHANNMVKYRGPDDFGYITIDESFRAREWKDEWLKDFASRSTVIGALGFRRLSIIDLSLKGHQPMHDGTGRFWIAYNGEVYNYLEIKRELESLGYSFASHTDTEVVLKAYMAWGSKCLKKFNGMWSFCILDIGRKQLFCVRDRLGIKPFYYYFDHKHFIFGSEAKQVLQLKPHGAALNSTVFFDYLALGSYGNETRETFFDDVWKLLPGQYLVVDLSQLDRINIRTNFWWDLPNNTSVTTTCARAVYDKIHSLLEDSIRLRLRSDVPVGTCLSGGLDSSGIVCLVDRIIGGKLKGSKHKVFVIGSVDPKIDETHYAKMVVKATSVEACVRYPDSVDLARDLERFIWHHDEPLLNASIFGGWQVYKLAKECGVSVVLDGQGSDELLGGYYHGPHVDLLDDLVVKGQLVDFNRQLRANAYLHNCTKRSILKGLIYRISRRIAHNLLPDHYKPNMLKQTNGWLNKDFVRTTIRSSHVVNRDYYPVGCQFSSFLKKQVYDLTKITNLPGILRQVDRNSMAFSLEARVPFLDHRLVEFFYSLPSNYILRDGYTKYAYRRAMEGIIPEDIRLRTDKRGFTMPDRILLKGALPFVKNIIDCLPSDSNIYNVESIKQRIGQAIVNETRYKPIVWRILNGIIWQNQFQIN
jgi:asparagine synthase (glutamine-hydrolysing)